ncbi:38704_t:CDS:1, partial [Gigaspora margarita]
QIGKTSETNETVVGIIGETSGIGKTSSIDKTGDIGETSNIYKIDDIGETSNINKTMIL